MASELSLLSKDWKAWKLASSCRNFKEFNRIQRSSEFNWVQLLISCFLLQHPPSWRILAYLGPAGGCGQEFAAHFAIAAGWDVEASGGRHGNSFRCHTWHTCVGDLVWTEISTVHRILGVPQLRLRSCGRGSTGCSTSRCQTLGFPQRFFSSCFGCYKAMISNMISMWFPYDFHMIFPCFFPYDFPRCQARHRPMWSRPSGWELPAMAELGKIHRWMASPLENIEDIWGIFKLNWSEKFFSKLLIYVLYLSLSDFACLSPCAWNIDTLRIWVAVDLCIALRPLTAFREVLADVLDQTSDPKMEHQMGGVRVAQDLRNLQVMK